MSDHVESTRQNHFFIQKEEFFKSKILKFHHVWWNKESEILNSHLKCFSLEKHIGVRRKEDTVNHATSYEILCEKENPRVKVKFSHLRSPDGNYQKSN